MKITRKELRKMINESIFHEHRIKPSIPDLESDDHIKKIDALARGENTRDMADVMADTYGYTGSYSSDLDDYDNIAPLRMSIWISKTPYDPNDRSFTHEFVIPHHLVDELIEEHNNVQSYNVSGLIVTAGKIEDHIMADLAHQFPGHVIDEFTPDIKGYRADEYRSAWYEAMEYYSVGGF